jgi:hypothetical protein
MGKVRGRRAPYEKIREGARAAPYEKLITKKHLPKSQSGTGRMPVPQ